MTSTTLLTGGLADRFKASLRLSAASVYLLASQDEDGLWHGMAVTSASSLSIDPPSMLAAVNRAASVHAVISQSRRFCLNLMTDRHSHLLERYAKSDLRDQRFTSDHWSARLQFAPTLLDALCTHTCLVEAAHDYGTHTVFFGKVEEVILSSDLRIGTGPLVWLNGAQASILIESPV
jgi:flavin reductase (DIM6/NTAB) family NADH-FMN oxidoreductase RutF